MKKCALFLHSFIISILLISPTNRTSPPTPVIFQFDQSLLEDKDTLGKLQPNSLAVDNLTVQWLRNRLVELEISVKECQEKQTKMQMENGTQLISIPPNVNNGISRKENSRYGTIRIFSVQKALLNKRILFSLCGRHSKDLTFLRCQEKQMLKMADLIKTALNDVGCEELPSGCDDLSVDSTFIENSISNNDQQPVSWLLKA